MTKRAERIYIAASSSELDRVKRARGVLQRLGFDVRADWVEQVEQHGGDGNPREAPRDELRAMAESDVAAVRDCDAVLWLLPRDHKSEGAAFEVGAAYACGVPIFVAGDYRRTIFSALAYRSALSDVAAIADIVERFLGDDDEAELDG
jgi:nucleoside 2-deoxyribosyltransferase